ncbi:MAG: methyltransferase domain-containing protein [Patescibacteria group bacterium]
MVGSDISEKVIEKAKKNIEFSQEDLLHSKRSSYEFFVSDATHVSEHLKPESIDAIVTEPFMGSADIKFENIKNTIKGLEKLYIGCLRDWYRVLKPLGRVVIALPEYRIEDKMFFVKKVIDRCENLGYTTLHGPIEYSRPQAIVRREFFVLQKHGTH